MGNKFVDEKEKAQKHPTLISPEDYERIVAENPDMMVLPEYMNADNAHRNMHWKLEDEPVADESLP